MLIDLYVGLLSDTVCDLWCAISGVAKGFDMIRIVVVLLAILRGPIGPFFGYIDFDKIEVLFMGRRPDWAGGKVALI